MQNIGTGVRKMLKWTLNTSKTNTRIRTGFYRLRTGSNDTIFEYGNAVSVSLKGEEFSTS
jgi:hypothetical protein